MEGYDTILTGSLHAYPTYARRFGTVDASTGLYQNSAGWQSAMSSGTQAGLLLRLCALDLDQLLLLASSQLARLCVGNSSPMLFDVCLSKTEILGSLHTLRPFRYDCPCICLRATPLPLRGYLTAYTNFCFAGSKFIGAGVLQSFIGRQDHEAWRYPFALQWIWIPILAIDAFFMPESPWYLVRKSRYAQAEKNVLRLMTEHERPHANFNGVDLRRTEIAIVTFLGQITCGAQFAFSATYFFQQTGLIPDDSCKLNLGMYFGYSGFLPSHSTSDLSVGPFQPRSCPPAYAPRLWSWLGTVNYYVAQVLANVIQPYMINSLAWNWKRKAGSFRCVFASLTVAWAFFRLPETKDRSYEELDLMFMVKVLTCESKNLSRESL
ncbi:general substrate transporter [Penicillium argentinense]|uniref:General substrate transporter n=1 Tax=Penicillium argentinense TaxID=1131581 RepID=A0A9W9FGL0_9EURO|nr:general substrate transporter [Penicillium argentinense]KAJ5099744.1 general substrate transporter [Penicillium argentinense]